MTRFRLAAALAASVALGALAAPAFADEKVLRTRTTTASQRPPDRRPRQDRPRQRGAAGIRRPAASDRGGAAAARDLQQLPRPHRPDAGRRLRHALWPERGRDGPSTASEGRSPATNTSPTRDGSGAQANVTMMVQIPELRPGQRLHRHGAVLRLARRLWRHRDRGRMGAQARLRRRLHRQGHRHRRARPAEQHRQPDPRRARRCGAAGDDSNFTADLSAASARPSTPRRRTASPSSTRIRSRTRKRIGAATCCARSSSHSTCSTRNSRSQGVKITQAQHHRDRLQRLQRRRRLGARGRAGRRGADRRRSRSASRT